jgi:hypothetical protein
VKLGLVASLAGRNATGCGIIGADTRPKWREQPARESLTGAHWQEPTSKGVEDVDAEMIVSVLSAIAIAANSRCWHLGVGPFACNVGRGRLSD